MALLLNADLGESWYDRRIGNDAGLMPYLDLCNIACGMHGGDALTMRRTIELAKLHDVRIGAHPSFPDRKNFGRVEMDLPLPRLEALILYQVSALQGMVRAIAGEDLYHIKPHGALYHYANRHEELARGIARIATQLRVPYLMGPPTGELRRAAERAGLAFLAEGFADRRYTPDLTLQSRSAPNACIDTIKEAAAQAKLLAAGQVRAMDGITYPLQIKTLCIHGDHAGAVERAQAIRVALAAATPPR
ncbi:5-oxoprolinase subunit A [Neolewinella maritima]|uniref:5-oxoprolinase subunit A n=1 Tax=Neolewinella maritima TaxID=1383882 RepID=A0ABM9B482_9BACT|nr:5-oxoprolinase subunit PxpA [Neolewinella maritima]CAH1002142.1 5-oxoprolinase subunit A [Neolewinella maritima]